MLYGALSERTKKAQSDSFSPALPHPHIISWKIPDICCNFFFFFCSGTGKALISRCHWILQRTPKSVRPDFPSWPAAIGLSTNNTDKVREQGFSALCGPLAKEVTQEIPNKTLPVHGILPLFVCLLVFGSPLLSPLDFFSLPFSF